MEDLQRIRLLEDRLNRLETRDSLNYGTCRKLRREIEFLKRKVRAEKQ